MPGNIHQVFLCGIGKCEVGKPPTNKSKRPVDLYPEVLHFVRFQRFRLAPIFTLTQLESFLAELVSSLFELGIFSVFVFSCTYLKPLNRNTDGEENAAGETDVRAALSNWEDVAEEAVDVSE